MSFFAGVLTFFLVVNCVVLILLILIQLPKKDAGAGLAFGGGAADALFGAGSGNVLTKITKWATLVFFVMALFLGYLEGQIHHSGNASGFEKSVQEKQSETPMAPIGPATPAAQPVIPPVSAPAAMPPSTQPPASSNPPATPAQSR